MEVRTKVFIPRLRANPKSQSLARPSLLERKTCQIVTELFSVKNKAPLAEWLERLTAKAGVATVLGPIPASSDLAESEGPQMKQCW